MSTSKIITLKYPIVVKEGDGEKTINTLMLGRLKAKHLKLLPKEFFEVKNEEDGGRLLPPEAIVPLISALSGLTEEQVGEIDLIEDLPLISKEVSDFLSESLEIGKK